MGAAGAGWAEQAPKRWLLRVAERGNSGCRLGELHDSPVSNSPQEACVRPLPPFVAAGDDELYTSQRPLPLAELHSPDRPGGGVLALLKMVLWHALWAETPPAPGGRGAGDYISSARGTIAVQLIPVHTVAV